jgi:hypothetical protein
MASKTSGTRLSLNIPAGLLRGPSPRAATTVPLDSGVCSSTFSPRCTSSSIVLVGEADPCGASNSASPASPGTTPGSSTAPPPSTCATASAVARRDGDGRSPDQHQARCRHPAKPAWLATRTHVADARAWPTAAQTASWALPDPQLPLYSGYSQGSADESASAPRGSGGRRLSS